MWSAINFYGYYIDVSNTPTYMNYEFTKLLMNNIEDIMNTIGNWRLLFATIIPLILYLLCVPIMFLEGI